LKDVCACVCVITDKLS